MLQGTLFFFLRFFVTLAAMGWSSRAAMSFIGDTAPEGTDSYNFDLSFALKKRFKFCI